MSKVFLIGSKTVAKEAPDNMWLLTNGDLRTFGEMKTMAMGVGTSILEKRLKSEWINGRMKWRN